MLCNFDTIAMDRFKSLYLVVALRSVNKHFFGAVAEEGERIKG